MQMFEKYETSADIETFLMYIIYRLFAIRIYLKFRYVVFKQQTQKLEEKNNVKRKLKNN